MTAPPTPTSLTSSGYVTDVAYPRAFVPQIAPPTLRLVAALNGVAPPPEHDFDYCEVGSATADTLATLAAANPKARFVGIELAELHVTKAEARATQGGLTNLRFVQRDIEGIDDGAMPLPQFDFIVAHGLWTWISQEKRAALLAFVGKHLKPGGLFYVSYNALPGWSSVEPLRRLMLDNTKPRASTIERAREGMQFAQRMADSGAAFFAAHPTAKSMLALMQKAGLPYVVHEYFHADWQPMYVADVARTMAASGLAFLGQVPLYANVKELAIPPSLKRMAETVTDRIQLESLKDFATNELFRADVYVRGDVDRSLPETQFYFEGTTFGTLAPRESLKAEVALPFYTLEYGAPVYQALLTRLAAEPAHAMALANTPELAEVGPLRIGACLQSLVMGGQLVPMPGAALITRTPTGESTRYRVAHPYNALVLEEALREEAPLVFASPVTGAGVQVSILEALCIRLVTEATLRRDAYAAKVREYAASRAMPMAFGERKIKDADELVKVMAREIDRFRAGPLGKLVELGVLAVI